MFLLKWALPVPDSYFIFTTYPSAPSCNEMTALGVFAKGLIAVQTWPRPNPRTLKGIKPGKSRTRTRRTRLNQILD